MPIVAPGRRFGAAYQSQALKKRLSNRRRATHASLLLTPMVDMFTILVLYLIQQFNATGQILFIDPELKLPEARKAVDVAGNPPLVTIGREAIAVQGKPVEQTSVLAQVGQWEAPKLEAALLELRALSTRVEEKSGGRLVTESAQGILMVQADVTVPYRLVKKVLAIAAKSGFARADFAVARAPLPAPLEP